MKNLLPIAFLLLFGHLFAQSAFTIGGKTNVLANGKAVLNTAAFNQFHLFKIKQDTVLIRNHSFVFTGTLTYPGECCIEMIGKDGRSSSSEPFFIGAGDHKLIIDKALDPHDSFENGFGVSLENDPVNDAYIKKYLPLRNKLRKRCDDNDEAMYNCSLIKDSKKRKGCFLPVEAERANLTKNLNDVLLSYAKAYPRSPIVPWLLYDRIFDSAYSDGFEEAVKETTSYSPTSMVAAINGLLAKRKLTSPGSKFALTEFVRANAPKNILQNKYILVDFWFSGCAPCRAQFEQLKSVYQKFNKKGFEIIAVSVDKQEAVSKYKKLIANNGYVWPQILDLNGVKTKTIDVNGFPTWFLVDRNWKIVKMDLQPDDLDSFLEDHLR